MLGRELFRAPSYNAWYYIQCSYKSQFAVTFMNSVWHRKCVVRHINKWSYICSIIFSTDRTGFLGNLKLPSPSLCRNGHHSAWHRRQMPYIDNSNSYIHMKYTTFSYGMICIKTVCYIKHTCKKRNFYNGMKSTVTLSHTCCVIVFLSWTKHTRTCIDIKWNP